RRAVGILIGKKDIGIFFVSGAPEMNRTTGLGLVQLLYPRHRMLARPRSRDRPLGVASVRSAVTHLRRMAFAVGTAPVAMPTDWWFNRSVRQQAEPPLRRKAVSGVSITV